MGCWKRLETQDEKRNGRHNRKTCREQAADSGNKKAAAAAPVAVDDRVDRVDISEIAIGYRTRTRSVAMVAHAAPAPKAPSAGFVCI